MPVLKPAWRGSLQGKAGGSPPPPPLPHNPTTGTRPGVGFISWIICRATRLDAVLPPCFMISLHPPAPPAAGATGSGRELAACLPPIAGISTTPALAARAGPTQVFTAGLVAGQGLE